MQRTCLLGAVWLSLFFVSPVLSGAVYRKATEGREVVKDKIYPKKKKVELNLPNFGIIMNQSYINTFLLSGGLTYYANENWGIGVDLTFGSNSDKGERTCIENFFYDPQDEVSASCSESDGDSSLLEGKDVDGNTFPRFGPAYVPIREIETMAMVNVVWTPVYGKQLIFLNSTSYFDLYVELGGGIATSTFYKKRDFLENGNTPRGLYTPEDSDDPDINEQARLSNDLIGAQISEVNSYGILGRPEPETQSNLMFNFGVGQKFHFGKSFHMKIFLRNQVLLGTPQGFDNLLSIMFGGGFRI